MATVKGLIDSRNILSQKMQPGNEFEVHPSFKWIDVDDAAQVGWSYDPATGLVTDPAIAYAATPQGARNIMVEARLAAYGPIGEQLDMIYKDMMNGTTTWKDRITAAKLATPSVPAPPLPGA
jgi:hypothetical protein